MAKINKESLVIIVDVGLGAEEFTEKAAECCLNIIKHKIYYDKFDLMSILLLRTKKTDNLANKEQSDQYTNISQVMPGSQIPTWDMAKEFTTSLHREKSNDGDWVDALIVAIGIIDEDTTVHKAKSTKIVLFHNFNSLPSSLDEHILDKLKELNSKLIIVSDNVRLTLNASGKLVPEFTLIKNKTNNQVKNEALVSELKELYSHTTLCNFKDAPSHVLRKELKSPWPWNSTLTIGTKIVINITGVIAIKKEDKIPRFEKKPWNSNHIIRSEKKYYSGVYEIGAETKYDTVGGYMLGDSPLAYDPSLGQASSAATKKGIHFIGFVPADNIPQEHFSGESTYALFPQKGKHVSAKILYFLNQVMEKNNLSILGWKVFNNGYKPKLVVLLPTLKHEIPALSMIELSYHSQHRFWDFLKLSTRKNQPNEEELNAVDEFIEALDLCLKLENDGSPENFDSHNDHLPFEFLPNIQQQYLIDFLSRKIINQTSSNTSKLLDVPPALKNNASLAAENIKRLFNLQFVEPSNKEKLKMHLNTVSGQKDQEDESSTSAVSPNKEITIDHVGTVTPAEDFKLLVEFAMKSLSNGAERNAKFHHYAYQMRTVLSELLFKSMTKQNEKIEKALTVYRKLTIASGSPQDYNDWIRDVRTKLIERKMVDFWEEVIVKNKLGLCMEKDSQAEEDFYCIPKYSADKTNIDDVEEEESAMELLDML